ncbi:MAG: hypothetical protein V1731_03085 [Candidatus Aenigmatarchaeota archaeon]
MEMRDFSGQKLMIVALLVILMFFVGGSITGYTTSLINLQKELSNATACADLSKSLESASADFEACAETLNSTSSLFTGCKSNLLTANADTIRLTAENIIYEKNVTELGRDADKWSDAFKNAANDVCCIRRAANTDAGIRYFYLSNGKTYCTNSADASLGTVEIACP